MSDLSECCYGMGFGPEGDGVELKAAPPGFNDDVGDYWSQPGIGILTPGIGSGAISASAKKQFTVKCDDGTARHSARQHGAAIGRAIQRAMERDRGSFENIQWPQWAFDDKPESNAKPALPALTRQAGEKYKGLGFCDGMDQ